MTAETLEPLLSGWERPAPENPNPNPANAGHALCGCLDCILWKGSPLSCPCGNCKMGRSTGSFSEEMKAMYREVYKGIMDHPGLSHQRNVLGNMHAFLYGSPEKSGEAMVKLLRDGSLVEVAEPRVIPDMVVYRNSGKYLRWKAGGDIIQDRGIPWQTRNRTGRVWQMPTPTPELPRRKYNQDLPGPVEMPEWVKKNLGVAVPAGTESILEQIDKIGNEMARAVMIPKATIFKGGLFREPPEGEDYRFQVEPVALSEAQKFQGWANIINAQTAAARICWKGKPEAPKPPPLGMSAAMQAAIAKRPLGLRGLTKKIMLPHQDKEAVLKAQAIRDRAKLLRDVAAERVYQKARGNDPRNMKLVYRDRVACPTCNEMGCKDDVDNCRDGEHLIASGHMEGTVVVMRCHHPCRAETFCEPCRGGRCFDCTFGEDPADSSAVDCEHKCPQAVEEVLASIAATQDSKGHQARGKCLAAASVDSFLVRAKEELETEELNERAKVTGVSACHIPGCYGRYGHSGDCQVDPDFEVKEAPVAAGLTEAAKKELGDFIDGDNKAEPIVDGFENPKCKWAKPQLADQVTFHAPEAPPKEWRGDRVVEEEVQADYDKESERCAVRLQRTTLRWPHCSQEGSVKLSLTGPQGGYVKLAGEGPGEHYAVFLQCDTCT